MTEFVRRTSPSLFKQQRTENVEASQIEAVMRAYLHCAYSFGQPGNFGTLMFSGDRVMLMCVTSAAKVCGAFKFFIAEDELCLYVDNVGRFYNVKLWTQDVNLRLEMHTDTRLIEHVFYNSTPHEFAAHMPIQRQQF